MGEDHDGRIAHEVLPMPTSTDVAQITYPQSDGQPMADNTKQFRWIVTIQGGLDALFRADPQVFVAGDLLWYPVEGHPEICMAPDLDFIQLISEQRQ